MAAMFAAAIPSSGLGVVSATLQLRAELRLVSTRGAACPPGLPETVECPARTGAGVVPGLGAVNEAYTYLADLGACETGSVKILGYPVRFTVAGKGELLISVAERPECVSQAAGLSISQTFTVTGGTGLYAEASGGGTVTRALGQTNTGAAGIETWTGTLTVPGLEFDLTRPVLSGAVGKTVRIKRRAPLPRVAFAVTAVDDRDGELSTTCTPRSRSRFNVGRTRVTCTATDSSGNTGTATFTVTVRRAK